VFALAYAIANLIFNPTENPLPNLVIACGIFQLLGARKLQIADDLPASISSVQSKQKVPLAEKILSCEVFCRKKNSEIKPK
jgi:hypothetical protein